jgi:hypothetical protein
VAFTRTHCGLASDTAACRCNRQVANALKTGRIRGDACDFAATKGSFLQTRAMIRQVDEAQWALQVHRTNHPKASSVDLARRLMDTLGPNFDALAEA